MANIKQVKIEGIAPYNLHEFEALQPMLAFLAGPTTGLKLLWTGSAGTIPNEHGGNTCMYSFTLIGEEAVSWSWIDKFKQEIVEAKGKISSDSTTDIEGG